MATDNLDTLLLGRGVAYPLRVDETTGDFVLSEGTASVADSVRNIVMTAVGERVMNEEFGTTIEQLVFEAPSSVEQLAPVTLRDAIIRYEPRVASVKVGVRRDDANGRVVCEVSYLIKATRKTETVETYFEVNK